MEFKNNQSKLCFIYLFLFCNVLFSLTPSSCLAKKTPSAPPTIGITYKGGRVLTNPINIYVIWYGDWNVADKSILKDLIASYSKDVNSGLLGSVFYWWKINTLYYNKIGTPITNNITLKSETSSKIFGNVISYSQKDIPSILDKAITDKAFIIDKNGVYVVFTSENVKVYEQFNKGGLCKDYDGFHTVKQLNATVSVPFIFVGNPNTQCPYKYLPTSETSPNGNVGVDSMVNTFSTLFARTATSVDKGTNTPRGWLSPSGLENAELCANRFGKLAIGYATSTGEQYLYNLIGVNGRKYFIQENYDLNSGNCVLQSYS